MNALLIAVIVSVGIGIAPHDAAPATSLTTETAGITIDMQSDPGQPTTRTKTAYTVRLVDGAGKRLANAQLTLTGRMTDGMTVVAPLRPMTDATYRGEVLYTMAGRWELRLRIIQEDRRIEVPFVEDVSR